MQSLGQVLVAKPQQCKFAIQRNFRANSLVLAVRVSDLLSSADRRWSLMMNRRALASKKLRLNFFVLQFLHPARTGPQPGAMQTGMFTRQFPLRSHSLEFRFWQLLSDVTSSQILSRPD